MSADESLERAEALLARLESARVRLESTDDPETAIEVLGELSEISKAVEAAFADAQRRAEEERDGRT